MPSSMTGFAAKSLQGAELSVLVEVRGVNSRNREIFVHLPWTDFTLEGWVREQLEQRVSRGRVTLNVRLEAKKGEGVSAINTAQARVWLESVYRLAQDLNLPMDLRIADLLSLPQVMSQSSRDEAQQKALVDLLRAGLPAVLDEFVQVRRNEGQVLSADLLSILTQMEEGRQSLLQQQAELQANQLQKYRQRIRLLLEHEADEIRIAQEVAILLEKMDITEELVRLDAHFQALIALMKQEKDSGRASGFLVQEIQRELNTTGAKSQSLEVTQVVLQMKNQLEKVREQIQNLE